MSDKHLPEQRITESCLDEEHAYCHDPTCGCMCHKLTHAEQRIQELERRVLIAERALEMMSADQEYPYFPFLVAAENDLLRKGTIQPQQKGNKV